MQVAAPENTARARVDGADEGVAEPAAAGADDRGQHPRPAGPRRGVHEPVDARLDEINVAEHAQALQVVEAQLGGTVAAGCEPAAIGREAPAEGMAVGGRAPVPPRPQRARVDRVEPRRRTGEPVDSQRSHRRPAH